MRAGHSSSRPEAGGSLGQELCELSGARILLVGNTPPPHGGVAMHVQALYEKLHALDAWVRVLSLGAHHSGPSIQGVKSASALASELSSYALLGFLPHLHMSGHTLKSWLIAAAVAALRLPRGKGALLTLHSGMVPRFFESQPRALRASFGHIARRFSAILAVNAEVAEAVRSLGVASSKIRVLAAGFIPGAPEPAPRGLELLRQRSTPLIVSAIADGPIYGARELIRALPCLMARFPRVGLALFGPCPTAPLQELARELGVLERVAFLGELSHARSLGTMARGDVFLRATRADGDAISVREALCLGKPVAASRVGERPEAAHLFEPGDVPGMCEAIASAWAAARHTNRVDVALDARARAEADLAQVLASYLALLDRAPLPERWPSRRSAASALAALPERVCEQRNEARLDRLVATDPFGKPVENRLNVDTLTCPFRGELNAIIDAPRLEGKAN
ncbi:MAG: glycosyltransferase [Myxococcales bacterium]|nr:glycosyltransferase [Myxococcales bacterium]